jgi:hypothetical protein
MNHRWGKVKTPSYSRFHAETVFDKTMALDREKTEFVFQRILLECRAKQRLNDKCSNKCDASSD